METPIPPPLLGNLLAYLMGCALAVLYRAGSWLSKQPAGTGFEDWARARKWSNLSCVAVALAGALAWADGSIVRWTGLEGKVDASMAASAPAGLVLTLFARLGVAWAEGRLFGTSSAAKGDDE